MCIRDSRRGPSGKTFNFTFHRRGTDEQLDELGRLMTNVCKLVPGGVVCFLASYGYLDQARKEIPQTGVPCRFLVGRAAIRSCRTHTTGDHFMSKPRHRSTLLRG